MTVLIDQGLNISGDPFPQKQEVIKPSMVLNDTTDDTDTDATDIQSTRARNTRSNAMVRTAWDHIAKRCDIDLYEKLTKKAPSKATIAYGALSKAQQNKISKIIQTNIKALAEQKSGTVGTKRPGPAFSKRIIPVDEVRQCSHCTGVFNKIGNLKKHTLTHFKKSELLKVLPQEKPYLCPKRFCSKRFLIKVTLMRHWAFEHYNSKHDEEDKLLHKRKDISSNLICGWYDIFTNTNDNTKRYYHNTTEKIRLTYGHFLYGDDEAKMRENFKLSRAQALEPQVEHILKRIEDKSNISKTGRIDKESLDEEEKDERSDPTYGEKPKSKKVKVSSFLASELERFGVMDNVNVEVAKPFPSNVFKAGPASSKKGSKATAMEIQLESVYKKISNNDQKAFIHKKLPRKDMMFESPEKRSDEQSRTFTRKPGPASTKSSFLVTPTKVGPASLKISEQLGRPRPGPASRKNSPPKNSSKEINYFDVDDDDDITMIRDDNNNNNFQSSDVEEGLLLRRKPGPASAKVNRPGPASSKRSL